MLLHYLPFRKGGAPRIPRYFSGHDEWAGERWGQIAPQWALGEMQRDFVIGPYRCPPFSPLSGALAARWECFPCLWRNWLASLQTRLVRACRGGVGDLVQKWSRRHKSQAIKNPKEFNFAWGFSVLVVPRDGIEPPTRGFSKTELNLTDQ